MSKMLSRRGLLTSPFYSVAARRPDIVFVLVDDLRWDELGCTGHPFAQTPNADRIAREGANFRNAFATTPLCSPSRASFLTGQYPHRHGIIDNTDRRAQSHRLVTWPRRLHDNGYETAFIGKWHMGNDDAPRPGFDRWISFPGQGESTDPLINDNGKPSRVRGYITDILNRHAVDFISRPRSKPFCLYLAHKAIHPNTQQAADGSVNSTGSADEFIVADRHKRLYSGATIPRRGNYRKPPRGKPALEQKIAGLPPLGPSTATDDATILNRSRMIKAIDEGLGEILEALRKTGRAEDTMVVFTSDHGYFYGEHCLNAERRLAYEETIRIPLLMRYPRLAKKPTRPAQAALSIDMAPTMLDLAGIPLSPGLQGASLLPVLRGQNPKWREDFLIEYYSDTVFRRIRRMGYRAVRNDRWKYVHYLELDNADELYDLRTDPFELDNRISAEPDRARRMRERLASLSASSNR
jgi:N-acetylglucosamine-6-sulfatase